MDLTTCENFLKGTVKPQIPFHPDSQAEALCNAMKGLGTKEETIVKVMSIHTLEQRQQIAQSFASLYQKDLVTELRSEIRGDFLKLVLALLESPAKYDAEQLHRAVDGFGTDEDTLIEILCSRSNEELNAIKDEYRAFYVRELVDDVADDTSGSFRNFLVSMLEAKRASGCPDALPNSVTAATDAFALFEAGEGRVGTNDTTFTRIFSERSFPQLAVIFESYKTMYEKDIEDVIKSETSFCLKDGYLSVVKLARNSAAYFAERLYKSMAGLGTNDNNLIRLITTRSEVDLESVKEEFQKLYGQTLEQFIIDDTSGHYRDLLIAICKGNTQMS